MERRKFLAAGALMGLGIGLDGAGMGLAQMPATLSAPSTGGRRRTPHRQAKTTRMFKSPGMNPNGLAVAPEGLWIGQQKLSSPELAAQYHEQVPTDRSEAAWLVDWNGKLLKTVITESRNTSGMAYGDNCLWMAANEDPDEGIYQTDMNSKLVRHLQIPLGPADNGGGSHGAQWHEGKLWIVANRMHGNLRVDPTTWTPEIFFPIYTTPEQPRWHDITFDDQGYMWQVSGNDSTSYATGKPGLIKYDVSNGRVVELVEFVPGSCDPHGLEFHDGALISCDAGIHPGWPNLASPSSGWIFRIDLL